VPERPRPDLDAVRQTLRERDEEIVPNEDPKPEPDEEEPEEDQ
jgi:hypothetical protein